MTVREDLADIDSRVLQAVERGYRGNPGITLAGIVRATSLRDRVVDRSLQRLRKQGKIEYVSPVQGWRVKKEKP